ncbi:hypothetical protein [Flagellimonas beolgyonensis]|uniref:hypothetical protein n=1 Tax=Flagellimonas beolgyonensis TaxID=864064 RepID=UPI003D64F5B4
MRNFSVKIVMIVVLLQSCIASKNDSAKAIGIDEAIQNSIEDFSSLNRLYKKDSVFEVTYIDTLYNIYVENKGGGNFESVRGNKKYEDYCVLSISANYNKMFYKSESNINDTYELPSRYLEKDGKLFYWWDGNFPVTSEIINVLKKYNLLQEDDGWSKLPEMSIDDSKIGVDYFFCRNDLTRYKRVVTNKSIEYYTPPKLNCN